VSDKTLVSMCLGLASMHGMMYACSGQLMRELQYVVLSGADRQQGGG
jgi:hypothetical protein